MAGPITAGALVSGATVFLFSSLGLSASLIFLSSYFAESSDLVSEDDTFVSSVLISASEFSFDAESPSVLLDSYISVSLLLAYSPAISWFLLSSSFSSYGFGLFLFFLFFPISFLALIFVVTLFIYKI